MSKNAFEGSAAFGLDQGISIKGSRWIDVLGRWDDVVISGEHNGHAGRNQACGVAGEAFEPGQLMSEFRTRLRVAVRQVEGSDEDSVYGSFNVARLAILGIAGQGRACQDRIEPMRQNRHTVPAAFALPDRAIAEGLKGVGGECSVLRLKFLQADNVGLRPGQPGKKIGQPFIDSVYVEGRDFQGFVSIEYAHMCDQDHFEEDRQEYEARGLVTRKQFGAILGAGMAMMLPRTANAATVADSDVTVVTPDGSADCYFGLPASGTAPGVLIWPDIFGLRPAFRQMGKRLAESGYSVLVVNPFYRVKKAPTAENGAATAIQQVVPLAQGLNETTHMTDAKAFIGWLDGQAYPGREESQDVGTQGYCMGGPIAFRTAAAVPDRVGAVGSFHGGNLVTTMPNSPHLQAAKSKAQFLVAIAANDDARSPKDKDVFEGDVCRSRRSAGRRSKCMQVPRTAGAPRIQPFYNEPLAEKAWSLICSCCTVERLA